MLIVDDKQNRYNKAKNKILNNIYTVATKSIKHPTCFPLRVRVKGLTGKTEKVGLI